MPTAQRANSAPETGHCRKTGVVPLAKKGAEHA
jgi:hypothetical protein